MVDGLIGDIFRQSSKISRLAKQSNLEHYQVSSNASGQLLCGRLRLISFGRNLVVTRCQVKVGAIDAAALGPFLK